MVVRVHHKQDCHCRDCVRYLALKQRESRQGEWSDHRNELLRILFNKPKDFCGTVKGMRESMPRRIKIKLRTCCEMSTFIHYAAPDSKSTEKLRARYVKITGGMPMDEPICHIPIGVSKGYVPICEDYKSGDWRAR